MNKIVVLVHGWSVTTTSTYGGLAEALESIAQVQDVSIDVRNIFLSRYISFRDEVRLQDISRAFEAAVKRELHQEFTQQRRFICITHSTGGPVIRDWIFRFYVNQNKPCPLSHLIMLAPANYGSALAQLGKSRLGRIKAWFNGVEPGDKVLDWLELGSQASLELNEIWMGQNCFIDYKKGPIYSFVISGNSIDRKLYDHVVPYTGEIGSDGVIRLSAANLNSTFVRLEQVDPSLETPRARFPSAKRIIAKEVKRTNAAAFKILHGYSHSGKDMGIMRSIGANELEHKTVQIIAECLSVETENEYRTLQARFDEENQALQLDASKIVEIEKVPVLPDRQYIHDPHSMLIFRISDQFGEPISKLDLKLTAGSRNSPDALPKGFLSDVQRNRHSPNTLTFFLNYSAMAGRDSLVLGNEVIREPLMAATNYGIKIEPHSTTGFVHYLPCQYVNKTHDLLKYIRPNETTVIDITLKRVVRSGVFQLSRNRKHVSFKDQSAGEPI